MSDLTKAALAVILDAINLDNPSANLTTNDVTLGTPTDISGSNPQRNSELVVSAKAGGPYTGTVTVRYNRLSLATIVATGNDEFEKGAAVNVSDIIALFNTRFATNLVAGTDYTDAALPGTLVDPGDTADITVTALAGSLVFIGAMTLTVSIPLEALNSVVTEEDLSGLTYTPPG